MTKTEKFRCVLRVCIVEFKLVAIDSLNSFQLSQPRPVDLGSTLAGTNPPRFIHALMLPPPAVLVLVLSCSLDPLRWSKPFGLIRFTSLSFVPPCSSISRIIIGTAATWSRRVCRWINLSLSTTTTTRTPVIIYSLQCVSPTIILGLASSNLVGIHNGKH